MIPTYEHRGVRISGPALAPADQAQPNAGAWTVPAAHLHGIVPRPNDTFVSADGGRWRVTDVGPLTGGVYPLTCTRTGG